MVALALMPQWPGLGSHPWSLSRLQSQDWRLSGQVELGAGNVPPTMDLESLLLSALAPNLQIQVGPPAENPHLLHPKNGGASGLEKLCMVPWAPYFPYFPTPASILRAAPRQMIAPSAEWCSKNWCVLGIKDKGEEKRDTSLWCFFWHIPLSWRSRSRVFCKTHCLRTRVVQEVMLFP